MSVLIKGMDEIPEDGAVLVVMHDNGKAYIKHACVYGYSMELVKLPEKHGRLIDADKLLRDEIRPFYYHLNNGDTAIPIIDIEHATTVIEAEGEG